MAKRKEIMTMSKKHVARSKTNSIASELVRRLGHFVTELEKVETLPDRFTCRTVKLDLKPHTYSAQQVKLTRKKLSASQAIFAKFLGVSLSTVHDWEQGIKPPSGSACRLMDEIQANPAYWRNRLTELAKPIAG
jgi:putative transcriptional regulator